MATRAYFGTQDNGLVERFLQVPAGTFARLAEFNSNFTPSPEQVAAAQSDSYFAKYLARGDIAVAEAAKYLAREADRDLAVAEDHSLYGLGRVPAAMQLGVCGDFFEDLSKSEELLAQMGFSLPEGLTMADMGGLYWV